MTVYIVFTVGTGTLAGHTETNPVFCCRLVQITTTWMKHDYSYIILFGHIQFFQLEHFRVRIIYIYIHCYMYDNITFTHDDSHEPQEVYDMIEYTYRTVMRSNVPAKHM